MATKKVDARTTLAASGIFGPQWHRWRGATLLIELEGEPAFTAKLDEVRRLSHETRWEASLTLLDTAGKPTGVRTLPWPPSGTVRVLRAP